MRKQPSNRPIKLFAILLSCVSAACGSYDKALIKSIDEAVTAIDSLCERCTYKSMEGENRDGSLLSLSAAYHENRPVMLRNIFGEFPYREHRYYLSLRTGQVIFARDIQGTSDADYSENRFYYNDKTLIAILSSGGTWHNRPGFPADYFEVENLCRDMIETLDAYREENSDDDDDIADETITERENSPE